MLLSFINKTQEIIIYNFIRPKNRIDSKDRFTVNDRCPVDVLSV